MRFDIENRLSGAMKRIRVVVSLITQDNDYQIEQAVAAKRVARSLGVDVQVIYADGDSIGQSQQILKFVQADAENRPDGVVLEPVGGTALPQVARAAVSLGIGWVVLNRNADYMRDLRKASKIPVFGVASDNQEVGRIEGRQLAALLPKGGSVVYIQGPPETEACKNRTAGMHETKPVGIEIKTIRGNWTESSASKALTAWLGLATSQQSHIDVIAAQNDAMAVGAKKALQQFTQEGKGRERWASIPLLGCDGVPKTGQLWVRRGKLTATVVVPPIAGTALEMLVHALRTGAVLPELTLIIPHSFPPFESLAELAH